METVKMLGFRRNCALFVMALASIALMLHLSILIRATSDSTLFFLCIILEGNLIFFSSSLAWKAHMASSSHIKSKAETIEERLGELEELKRRGRVMPEEYAVKTQEILKDI